MQQQAQDRTEAFPFKPSWQPQLPEQRMHQAVSQK